MILYKAGGGDRFLTYESYPVDYSKYPNCTFTMWCGDLRRGEPGHSWRSPIHMPRWASRITLKITDIRPECLPDIAHEDAIAEGSSGIDEYRELWDSLNSKRGYGWEANPWVWVIEFERVQEAKP
jgi:hypothetical protein